MDNDGNFVKDYPARSALKTLLLPEPTAAAAAAAAAADDDSAPDTSAHHPSMRVVRQGSRDMGYVRAAAAAAVGLCALTRSEFGV
jgi:hypothetical protein